MTSVDNRTPVLVLNCKLTGLAIMRSLGTLGIPVFGIDSVPRSPGLLSRYCRGGHVRQFNESAAEDYLDFVLRVGEGLGKRSILIPTSDELAVFVSEHACRLQKHFIFPRNDAELVKTLISKKGMYGLARRHAVPTPLTVFPENRGDVDAYAETATFPVMLKGIHGNRLQARTGRKMVIARTKDELLASYNVLEVPESPNLMIQEYIPGGDDQIYIFNGYFDDRSECLAAFTGHKIRQYPVHVGCASLGVCRWNEKVAGMTTAFMKAIGYRGILDIGYRLDPRDGEYKVLDINPRIGQAFRLFLAEDGMDVARILHADLTGRRTEIPVPREGRRWMIEDFDLESSMDYFKEGSLNFREWIASFKGLEEGAWFSWSDPVPFLHMCANMTRKGFQWAMKRFGRPGGGRVAPQQA